MDVGSSSYKCSLHWMSCRIPLLNSKCEKCLMKKDGRKKKKNKLVKVYNPLKKQKELFATYVLTNGMFINDKRVVENARTCQLDPSFYKLEPVSWTRYNAEPPQGSTFPFLHLHSRAITNVDSIVTRRVISVYYTYKTKIIRTKDICQGFKITPYH